MDQQILYAFGTALIIVGIILVIASVTLISIRKARNEKTKTETKAAGIIMIGPIPIIFGTDKKSVKTVIVLALALTIVLIIAMIVYYFLLR